VGDGEEVSASQLVPDPDVVHSVFYIDEMRREIMSFL
jgi:hypothetical protein